MYNSDLANKEQKASSSLTNIDGSISSESEENYATILDVFGIEYTESGYYWQIGEIIGVQGWILHVSAIRSQIKALLLVVLPELISRKIPFKVIKDKSAARNMLDGDFGESQVGKILSIYQNNHLENISFVKHLILLTGAFKGPAVPTDFHLGGTVYTRWGSFQPVRMTDSRGITGRYIYDSNGNLTPDVYTIPFSLPKSIEWPYNEIRQYQAPITKKTLRNKYKTLSVVAQNSKGNVYKGIYLRNILSIKTCIIKQGLSQMWSDEYGRNIKDRLNWQWEVYQDWSSIIRVPKLIDLFEEDGNAYLVMEEIKGPTLYASVLNKNYQCSNWMNIPITSRIEILHLLKKLIHIVKCIHQKGYVHRDITPVNFLIVKNKQLIPIDTELSASIIRNYPFPPFEFGTHGFMSPEQTRVEKPTLKEDIYGLCATLLTLMVGLPPGVFVHMSNEFLLSNLKFFLGEESISKILFLGLQHTADLRPTIEEIQQTLNEYIDKLSKREDKEETYQQTEIDLDNIRSLTENALRGLVTPPIVIHQGLWQSRIQNRDSIAESQRREFGKSVGMYEGITGALYLIGRAKIADLEIDTCISAYNKGWTYILEKYCSDLTNTVPGLYGGAAGIALSMATGIKAGLIEDSNENRSILRNLLELENSNLDLAQGVAGQGIVSLQCETYIEQAGLDNILNKFIELILSAQQQSGDWVVLRDTSGKECPATSLSFGNTGIIIFLLKCLHRKNDNKVLYAIDKSIPPLIREAKFYKQYIKNQGFRKAMENPRTSDGITGTILSLIKAYEILGVKAYRDIAEAILDGYPSHLVHENITQDIGLSGMGELYLEAYRVFNNSKWLERAHWIIHFFCHTCQQGVLGTCHWINNNAAFPTADLIVGNSGVIHFLLRAVSPNNVGFRLLQ